MNKYIWISDHEDQLMDQEEMLRRSLRRSEVNHLRSISYDNQAIENNQRDPERHSLPVRSGLCFNGAHRKCNRRNL